MPVFSPVPLIPLNDGNSIPQLGFGVWQVPKEETAGIVGHAFRAGYRMIDGARAYANEKGIGQAVAESGLPRDELFVTTKIFNDEQGYDSTLASFDGSMGRLGLDYLDLYLIHWPAPKLGLYVDTWKAMIRLKEEGRIRSIGVSNFQEAHLKRLLDETGVAPVVNQIELHPRFQQKQMRDVDARHGIVTQSWSPLGRNRLFDNPELLDIGRKHGKTASQIMLRWHIQNGLVVIPKSVTPSRIDENFSVFDFALDAEDMKRIEALDDPNGRVGPVPDIANVWTGKGWE